MNERTKAAIDEALACAVSLGHMEENEMASTREIEEARGDLATARAELEAAIEKEIDDATEAWF